MGKLLILSKIQSNNDMSTRYKMNEISHFSTITNYLFIDRGDHDGLIKKLHHFVHSVDVKTSTH